MLDEHTLVRQYSRNTTMMDDAAIEAGAQGLSHRLSGG